MTADELGTRRGTLRAWAARNRNELTFTVLGILGGAVVSLLLARANPIWIIVLSNLTLIALFLLQRASIDAAIARLRHIVVYDLGVPWLDSQYHSRERHFGEEKRLLARAVVERVLPRLFEQIARTRSNPRFRLILDSGTTITPVFAHLVRRGILKSGGERFHPDVYTNNLAGIDELQRLDSIRDQELAEREFTLLGGRPLSRYRATTGPHTNAALQAVFDAPDPDGRPIVTVSVLTANWLLVGQGHRTLTLCARGPGHPEFKRIVADHSDYVVVVAPLGKILALDNVDELNELLPRDEAQGSDHHRYGAIEIPGELLERTYLLTTRRPEDSKSPLSFLSRSLFDKHPSYRTNFTIDEDWCPEFSPAGSADDVWAYETPHEWTRRHARRLFGRG